MKFYITLAAVCIVGALYYTFWPKEYVATVTLIGPSSEPTRLDAATQISVEHSGSTPLNGTPIQFRPCPPFLVVDEGPDVSLISLSIKGTALAVRLHVFYKDFFSRNGGNLDHQVYRILLDTRQPVDLTVSDVRSKQVTITIPGVRTGSHHLFYGTYSINAATQRKEALGYGACFNTTQ